MGVIQIGGVIIEEQTVFLPKTPSAFMDKDLHPLPCKAVNSIFPAIAKQIWEREPFHSRRSWAEDEM